MWLDSAIDSSLEAAWQPPLAGFGAVVFFPDPPFDWLPAAGAAAASCLAGAGSGAGGRPTAPAAGAVEPAAEEEYVDGGTGADSVGCAAEPVELLAAVGWTRLASSWVAVE